MATDIGKVDFGSAVSIAPPKNLSDGILTNFLGGRMGELAVAKLWGDWSLLSSRGYVFAARVNTAAEIPIFSTSTNAPALWNPAGSNKWVIPIRITVQPFAVGTPVFSGFMLQYLTAAGATAATGAPVITWTNQAPVCTKLGGGAATTLFSPAVSTYTTNPAQLLDLGMGHLLEGTAATGQFYSQMHYDFNGTLIMPPGTLISLGAAVATSTTYKTTFIFAEIPALM